MAFAEECLRTTRAMIAHTEARATGASYEAERLGHKATEACHRAGWEPARQRASIAETNTRVATSVVLVVALVGFLLAALLVSPLLVPGAGISGWILVLHERSQRKPPSDREPDG
jgi:hypothetical protein